MKISVITVVRNEENTIEDTILSVINQTWQDIEYIIVDGKSTDKTLDIISKYRDKIANVISEPDSGIYNAMNKGIKLATGDFLIFLNGNDTFYENKTIENCAKAIRKYPDCKMLIGNVRYTNRDYTYYMPEIKYHNNIRTLYDWIDKKYNHQAILYSRKVFDKYGLYNENLKMLSDNLLNLDVIKNKEHIIYTNAIISNFALGGFSSNLDNILLLKEENKIIAKKSKVNWFVKNIIKSVKYFLPNVYSQIEPKIMLNITDIKDINFV
ncbi:glycosyltransferase [bacterium]|nr:glycosyltransferase [bacterium]